MMSTEQVATGAADTPAPGWRTTIRSGSSLVIAIVGGLLIGALLLLVAGGNPLNAYKEMVTGTLGSRSDLGLVMVEVVPLLIVGLGLSVAFRARVWNIGAPGQMVLGALIGGWFALEVPIGFKPLMIACTFVVGAAAGGAWGWIVGKLKALWNVNEVISSLLLNYVAIFVLNYAVRKPLRDPVGFQPVSEKLPDAARLPDVPGFPVHIGLLVGLGLVPVMIYVLGRTPFGFRVKMLGLNPEAAEAAGVPRRRMYTQVMLLSGAFAGLAGVIQVMGPETRLTNNLPVALSSFGFTAIIVTLVGRTAPLGVLAASVFIGVLTLGGDVVQRTEDVARDITLVLQAILVLLLLVADRLRRRA